MKKLLDFNGLRYFYSKMKALIDNTADKTNAEIQAIKSKNATQDGKIEDFQKRYKKSKPCNYYPNGEDPNEPPSPIGLYLHNNCPEEGWWYIETVWYSEAEKSCMQTASNYYGSPRRYIRSRHRGKWETWRYIAREEDMVARAKDANAIGGIARENLLEHHWDWGTSYKDLNLATKVGMWRAGNATKNLPPNHFGESGDNDFLIFNAGIEPGENGEKWVKQTVYDVRGRGVWRRSRHNGAWEPWEWAWDGSRRNDKKTDNHVTEELRWQQYGDRHTIIDASSGKSLNGTVSFSNSNSKAPWIPGYPLLVGFNGSETWGVKVDTARTADTFHGKPPHEFATLTGSWNNIFAKSNHMDKIGNSNGFREQFMGDSSHPSGITFYRAGAFAINFGLDTDNYLKFGGGSHGSNSYKIYSERTITVSQATPGAMAEGCMHMTY